MWKWAIGERLVRRRFGRHADGRSSAWPKARLLARFFLFRVAEEAADHAAEIAQIVADDFVHQIGFGSFESAADVEIDRGVAGRFLQGLEVHSDRLEKLAADFVVQGQLRIQPQLAVEN